MSRVIADISVSVDGFVTGPSVDLAHGLGHGADDLHRWAMSDHDVDRDVLAQATEASGAVVMGRNLFDIIDGPHGWNEEMGYGANLATTPPFFVVTGSQPETVRLADSHDFTFVSGGVGAAVARARIAAGSKHVVVMGGGMVIRSCLEAGLLDELRLHIAPIVLGAGTPLFDGGSRQVLSQRGVRVSPYATHVTYAVEPGRRDAIG
jgi:dihydrofolate reductase